MRKKIIIGILIILIIVIIAISTLALFTWTSPNTSLTLEVGEMTDVIFQEGNDIIANNIGPVLNYEDGEITEFAIINNAENEQQAKFYLDISEISNSLKEESFKYILQISTDGTNYTTYKDGNFVNANTGELIISDGDVLPSGKTYYKFIIYIDGNMNNPTSMMNNSLKATLNVIIPFTVANLVEQMKTMANTETPDFSQEATTDEGIYAAEDDYGTSYYFRGAVENNYVKFAGYYWRIIRSNGDGTLRLIYDGTSAHSNNEFTDDKSIGNSEFNSNVHDVTYFGYMYGKIGSDIYEEIFANTNDSEVKKVVDNWYKTNIYDKGFNEYVADVIYCNDRQVDFNDPSYTDFPNVALFMGRNRNYERKPTLKCSQQNDRFTVDDITLGNGALTYPVGLITGDEAMFSAPVYLDQVWTMTPGSLTIPKNNDGPIPIVFIENIVIYNGEAVIIFSFGGYGVNPVLSLKSDVQLLGNGTIETPYEVIT